MDDRLQLPFDQRKIDAFHGTSKTYAAQMVRTGRIHKAVNPWDWLGHGIYFWEANLDRAILWAQEHYGAEAAVVRCEVGLMRCLDLANTGFGDYVRVAFDRVARAFSAEEKLLPPNTDKNRALDCLVLNYLCDKCLKVDTLRCPFYEGVPIFAGSKLYSLTHIQVVVRTEEAIKSPPALCYQA